MARSRAIVFKRATSLRRSRSFFTPSFCPSFSWKRRRKSCSAVCFSCRANSSSLRLRIFSESIAIPLLGRHGGLHIVTSHKAGLERQLVRSQAHGLGSDIRGYPFHFKQHLARPNDRYPMIGSALTFAHTSFGRLLRDRLIRKQPQPDLSPTPYKARHSNAAGFDLAIGDVPAFHNLQPIVPEGELGTAPSFAAHAATLLFAKLYLLWHQHD